jgi:protein-tyrosine-phosphatase
MEAIQIVQRAVELYKKIREAPDQVDKVGKRMQRLESYLLGLKELIDDKSRHSLALLRPAQIRELKAIINDIEKDAQQVYEILKKWDQNVGPFGLELRYNTVANALFALGSSTGKLEGLAEAIEQHKTDLRDFLQLLGYFGLNALLNPVLQPPAQSKPRSPSPAPWTHRKDCGTLFVDPYNAGRSKVAEAYTKLLGEWTTRAGGAWRIKFAHSAGFMVRNRSDCSGVLENFRPPLDKPIKAGKVPPNCTAMAALFDNGLFNYPYKTTIRDATLSQRSRGLGQDLFSKYDFILVFTGREYENLLRLKKALIEKNGKTAAPKGKGRILHLGSYLSKDGKTIEIVDAPKDKNGKDSRANWNKTVANIKMSIKLFLKRELGWV